MKNILEYIELNASKYADKTTFSDYENSITYFGLLDCSKRIGSAVSAVNTKNKPVAIYLDKGINLLCAMFGVVYSGNFYVVIDSEMPPERINKIFTTLNPVAIITDETHLENSSHLDFSGERFMFENAVSAEINEERLSEIRSRQIDTDPLYAL